MILDPNDFLKMALIVIVVAVLIIVVLPYLSGGGQALSLNGKRPG